ncbi:MAG: M48 family metallopeptidase [Phycisphaeraceae bacterium]
MQILLLLLILALFMHDALPAFGQEVPRLDWGPLLAVVIGPKLALLAGYWALCRRALGRLGKPGTQKLMLRLDRAGAFYRTAAIVLYFLDLYLGLLVAVCSLTPEWVVVIDELFVLTPTLMLLIASWWAYYPIERRVRESAIIGRLDAGLPIYPVLTRGQFVLSQVRHHMALILVPLLLIFTWAQLVERFADGWRVWGLDAQPVVVFLGAGSVFMFAPLIIRHVWDTVPLPAGELRDRLEAMCRKHRVGVRELLLWRTFGGMINAAVMGLFAPVRYILLTDALLEMVRREQVEAVMAHELAHVRRHHMFWLIATALGALGAFQLVFGLLFFAMAEALPAGDAGAGPMPVTAGWDLGLLDLLRSEDGIIGATLLCAGVGWAVVFGWVSRRIERQADTFAVQHMVGTRDQPERDAAGHIIVDRLSAETMIGALQQVALLNHMPIHKRSWRHGSIGWRQAYLRSLVGQPVDRLGIDRQMVWIKGAALATVLAVIGVYVLATVFAGAEVHITL